MSQREVSSLQPVCTKSDVVAKDYGSVRLERRRAREGEKLRETERQIVTEIKEREREAQRAGVTVCNGDKRGSRDRELQRDEETEEPKQSTRKQEKKLRYTKEDIDRQRRLTQNATLNTYTNILTARPSCHFQAA